MFDLAALSQPTVAPALQAAPLQNGGNAAETADKVGTAPALAFDALLAQQTAPPEPADAPLPESGKILPDAAKLLAALPQLRLAEVPVRPQSTKARTDAEHAASPASNQPQSPAQAALALAHTAKIELTPAPETPPAPVQAEAVTTTPTAQIMAARQVRQNNPALAGGETSEVPARPAPVAAQPLADSEHAETQRVEATSTTSLLADRWLAPPDSATPSPVRHEARTERVDFATLVDNLVRAREEASPRAVTASINHAEFGKVTLRFDQSEDRGMSVAMSSADPGFVRAVSDTAEAARTPTESTNPNSQGQAQAQAQAGHGDGQRQQPRQAEQPLARPKANTASPAREDEAPRTNDRGIYA